MEYSKKAIFLSFGFVIVAIISLHYSGWLKNIELIFRKLFDYPSEFIYSLSDRLLSERTKLLNANDRQTLSACQNSLVITKAENYTLKEDNQVLLKQLNFFASTTFTYVGAKVIGEDLAAIGRTILINRGARDGISVGNPAVIEEGILIGKVIKIFADSAIIILLSDSQSRVAATVLNNDHSIGLVEGGYDISIRMNSIPQNEVVHIGDIVVTSGLEDGIPRGLIVGTVEAVVKEAYEPFQYAILTPLSRLGKISLVSVLTSIHDK